MNDYLIPANSKKSILIFGLFNPSDLWIVGIGAALTLIMMVALSGDEIWITVSKLAPITLSILLVTPIPYYHNVVTYLREVVQYIQSEKEYRWRGWCAFKEYGDKQ